MRCRPGVLNFTKDRAHVTEDSSKWHNPARSTQLLSILNVIYVNPTGDSTLQSITQKTTVIDPALASLHSNMTAVSECHTSLLEQLSVGLLWGCARGLVDANGGGLAKALI